MASRPKKSTRSATPRTTPTDREKFILLLLSKNIRDFNELSEDEIQNFEMTLSSWEKAKYHDKMEKYFCQNQLSLRKSEITLRYQAYYEGSGSRLPIYTEDIINDVIAQLIRNRMVENDPHTPEKWIWLTKEGFNYLKENLFLKISLKTIQVQLEESFRALGCEIMDTSQNRKNWVIRYQNKQLRIRIEDGFPKLDPTMESFMIKFISQPKEFQWLELYYDRIKDLKRLSYPETPDNLPLCLIFSGGNPLERKDFVIYLDKYLDQEYHRTIKQLEDAYKRLQETGGVVLFMADSPNLKQFLRERLQ